MIVSELAEPLRRDGGFPRKLPARAPRPLIGRGRAGGGFPRPTGLRLGKRRDGNHMAIVLCTERGFLCLSFIIVAVFRACQPRLAVWVGRVGDTTSRTRGFVPR